MGSSLSPRLGVGFHTDEDYFLTVVRLRGLPERVHRRAGVLRLIAEGVLIDRSLCGVCHPNARPQRFCEPTYNGPEGGFWTCFLAKNCRAFKRARLQRFATVCDKLRHFSGVTAICNRLQRSATARKPEPMRNGSKDPVVEHKGIVGRGDVFSLATECAFSRFRCRTNCAECSPDVRRWNHRAEKGRK